MKSTGEDLSTALEGLRNRPIVTDSRAYAHSWEQTHARARTWRRRLLLPGVASACLVAIFGLKLALQPSSSIETRFGETRSLALEDGSRVLLDAHSKVRFRYSAGHRDVDLLDGQAHFEVAKDSSRPFRVHTPTAEVIAVGTQFDVETLPARTTVTLLEGRVNVLSRPSGVERETPRMQTLTPGERLEIMSDGRLEGRRNIEVASATAWQRGMVVLDDMPLTAALEVLNRYADTQIVVQGAALQSRRISGTFRAGDVATEALALRRYFGLRERSHTTREIVLAAD